jgi:hypothetical protein
MGVSRLSLSLSVGVCLVLTLFTASCSALNLFLTEEEDDTTLLLAALLLRRPQSSACSNVSLPVSGAVAQPGYDGTSGFSVLTGTILTQSGSPVIGANIVAVNTADTTSFVASFSSLSGDGSFYLAGVTPATNLRLAVEPIGSDFAGRIDSYLDCYRTPQSFTSGWFNGAGATTVPGTGSLPALTAPAAGSVTSLGTIRIPE